MICSKVFVFCTLLCVVFGNDLLLTKQKRQLFEYEKSDGISGDFDMNDNWHHQHHPHHHHHDGLGHFEAPHLQNHDQYHKHKVKTITITKNVPVPYEVIVEKKVPYKVEVPVDKPYHVYIPKPYPVYVEKKVPYKVEVPVPKPYTVEKKIPVPVKIPVDKPYPVYVPKPYKVYVEKKVPYTLEKHVPFAVKVPIEKPYPVHVKVEKEVPYKVEKIVPYPVEVKVDRPVPVHVEKPIPINVEKPVPYPIEKVVPYPVKVPVKIPIEVPYPVNIHEENEHGFEEGSSSSGSVLGENGGSYGVQKEEFGGSSNSKGNVGNSGFGGSSEVNSFSGFGDSSSYFGSSSGGFGGSSGDNFGENSGSKSYDSSSQFGGSSGGYDDSSSQFGGSSGGYDDSTGSENSHFGGSSGGSGGSSGGGSSVSDDSNANKNNNHFGGSSSGFGDSTGSGSSHGYKNQFGGSSVSFGISSGSRTNVGGVPNVYEIIDHFGGRKGGFGDSSESGSSHKKSYGDISVGFRSSSGDSASISNGSNGYENSGQFGGNSGSSPGGSGSSHIYKNHRQFGGTADGYGNSSEGGSDGNSNSHRYQVGGHFGSREFVGDSSGSNSQIYKSSIHFGDSRFGNTNRSRSNSRGSGQTKISIGLAAVIFTLVVVFIGCLLWRKRRNPETDSLAPHILVYPSYQGDAAPQLITNEIDFQLPQMRKTESLDDLLPEMEEVKDTNPRQLQHRSNSFSGGYVGLGGLNPELYRNPSDLEDELHYPEGHLGRVWFYLRYEPGCEKLLVTLLKMKNLPSRTVGTANGCDPIVKLHLVPNERRVQQSRQKKKTCNPFFDETFVFQVSEKELADHSLTMTVIDSGRNKKNCTIGHVTFPLRHLATEHPTDQLELLKMDLEKECDGPMSDLGELLVSLFYNENLHRLTVSVIAARNLKFTEEAKEDSYVRLTLNQHWHTVKVKRTNVVRGSAEPKYSQGFNFRVPSSNVDVTSLAFQVYQPAQGYGKDKLLGKCVLGSYMFARGKALTHWNSAFANPMEQIQNWQPLTE